MPPEKGKIQFLKLLHAGLNCVIQWVSSWVSITDLRKTFAIFF